MKIVLRVAAGIFMLFGLWGQFYTIQINANATGVNHQGIAAMYQISAVLSFGFSFVCLGSSSLLTK